MLVIFILILKSVDVTSTLFEMGQNCNTKKMGRMGQQEARSVLESIGNKAWLETHHFQQSLVPGCTREIHLAHEPDGLV